MDQILVLMERKQVQAVNEYQHKTKVCRHRQEYFLGTFIMNLVSYIISKNFLGNRASVIGD